MKWDIQQKIAKAFAELPDEELNRVQMEKITKNPILGPFLQKVRMSNGKEAQKPILIKT